MPVLCTWQETIITHPPTETRIALLLALECRKRQNAGRIEDAFSTFGDERVRGLYGLSSEDWQLIRTQETPYWHFEGTTIVVDFYSVYHEEQLRRWSRAGQMGGKASGKARAERAKKSAEGVGSRTTVERPLNNKEINTPYGSISKGTPPLGAGGAFDGDAHPRGEPATDEDMQAALDEMKRDFRDGTEHA